MQKVVYTQKKTGSKIVNHYTKNAAASKLLTVVEFKWMSVWQSRHGPVFPSFKIS